MSANGTQGAKKGKDAGKVGTNGFTASGPVIISEFYSPRINNNGVGELTTGPEGSTADGGGSGTEGLGYSQMGKFNKLNGSDDDISGLHGHLSGLSNSGTGLDQPVSFKS